MNSERRILVYKDYFLTFYRTLEAGAQKKIDYVLDVLKMQDRVSEKFVKYIKDGLYEIRASYNGNIYQRLSEENPEDTLQGDRQST